MTRTSLHISLSPKLKQQALDAVEEGSFSNPTDYVRHLIRQDVQLKRAQAEFKKFISKGINSPSSGQEPSEMVAELKEEIKQGV